jgi:uncharacterized membrane protein (UPF0127 family)
LRDYPRIRFSLPGGAALEASLADSFRRRLLGLAWMASPPRLGLLIPRCTSVHTVGMRFAIDVAFLGWPVADGEPVRVLDLRPELPPLRLATLRRDQRRGPRHPIATLELPAGRAESLGLGPGVELAES